MDTDIKELVTILLKSQNNLSNQVIELTKTVDSYVKTSQERIKFVEKQLDIIFRSITTKPTNGGENA